MLIWGTGKQTVYTYRQGEKLCVLGFRMQLFFCFVCGAKYEPDKNSLKYLTMHVAECFLKTTVLISTHPIKGHSFAGFERHRDSNLHRNVIQDYFIFMIIARKNILRQFNLIFSILRFYS